MVSYAVLAPMPLIKISFPRLFAGAIAALLLLVGLTLAVKYFGMFRGFDAAVLQFLYNARDPLPTNVFLAFTFLGEANFILPATILLAAVLFAKREFGYFFLFLGTIFGSAAFLFAFKFLAHRPRPTLFPPLVVENSFSFPSGHALLAVAFYGLIAYLAASGVQTAGARRVIFVLYVFLALTIGISRLYLGVHYPTDVLAGYLAGFAWLCFGIGLFEWFATKKAA